MEWEGEGRGKSEAERIAGKETMDFNTGEGGRVNG
jgi:hypothetical protein